MAISKCNNSSAFGPVRILWRHLKLIFKDNKCLENIINIANTYINLGHWLSHLKVFSSIIIPKLNKVTYNSPKSFCPIILLNTLGKLIEKVIGRCLQFYLSKSTWRTQTMFHNRYRSCLNAFNLIWIDQESSDKYVSLWHCLIFPIFKSPINSLNSQNSRIWFKNLLFLLWLSSKQIN